MSRAKLVATVAFAAALIVLATVWFVQPKTDQLTFVGWGGSTQDALKRTMFEPFSKQKGIEFSEDTYEGSFPIFQERAKSATGTWDVVEVETTVLLQAEKAGLLSPIPDAVRAVEGVKSDAVRDYAVGVFEWWTVLAWNRNRLPAGSDPPTSWTDFWDLKKYPGKRGMRKSPRTTMEIALLADGVEPSVLYRDFDVDRALRKLDQIKSSIVWWETGADQQTRLLTEYALTTAWNGRVVPMIRKGEPVAMSFDLALTDRDWWVVPRNAPNRKLAFDFLKMSLEARTQADFASAIGYGSVNEKARDLIDYSTLTMLPSRGDRLVDFNAQWWLDNESRVLEKWNEWLLKK